MTDITLKKNDKIELEITSVSLQGSGIGKHGGLIVFVPSTAVGDRIIALILKVKGNCAFAKIDKILEPSPSRIAIDCPVFNRCGGCVFRHISYADELNIKQTEVHETMKRIGHIDIESQPIICAEQSDRYRNKAQFPIEQYEGKLNIGFYAPHSHRVADCRDCMLQPVIFSQIINEISKWVTEYKVNIYNENMHRGLLRHIYIRSNRAGTEVLVCLVINGRELPDVDKLAATLTEKFTAVKGVIININTADTNVVLGKACKTICGQSYITDTLCGLTFKLSPLSFYQVNPIQAERLYKKVMEYASPKSDDVLLDLYCGTGTIGLSMAKNVGSLIGVEIIPEAVEDAKENAVRNGISNARFICADAAKAAETLNEEGITPDIIVVDPPRKGCDRDLLEAINKMSPKKLVYVSCNPSTLARDCEILAGMGYTVKEMTPVDMFPRTAHVETVVLMSKVR